jgi:uncharacterized protein YbjT (DUF2867 family)
MKRILITGATGNIGTEVVQSLCEMSPGAEIVAAVRNIKSAKRKFSHQAHLSFRYFDFENQDSFNAAFKEIDVLFLLRPPQLLDVDTYFEPLLRAAKANSVEKIVFLSVQGAEKSKVIPHNKIERLIKELGFAYIFLRPGYFMQNLSTTLAEELRQKQTLTLPSAKAKFNWVDVKDIGEAAAVLLDKFDHYQNQVFKITGEEIKKFDEVTEIMTSELGKIFSFKSINPFSFFFKKRREGVESGFALVMTMLHFIPRLQKEPELSDNYFKLTGKSPTRLKEFIQREKEAWL